MTDTEVGMVLLYYSLSLALILTLTLHMHTSIISPNIQYVFPKTLKHDKTIKVGLQIQNKSNAGLQLLTEHEQ